MFGGQPQAVSFQLRQLQLQGWRSGTEGAPLCLCLHGWLDNANSFLPLAQALPEFQLLAVDLPGHGRSDHRSPDAHYHFLDWVDDLLQLVTVIDAGPLHLIGHSMGGMIAGAFAAAFPEYVKSLVLIDSLGLVTAPEHNTTQQLRQAMLSRQKRLDKRKPYYPSLEAAAAARLQQSDFAMAQAMMLAERGTELVAADEQQAQRWTWSADLRLREVSAYRFSRAQALQLIADIQQPTLAILASNSIEMMAQAKPLFLPVYPHLQVAELTGGHHLHMTEPEAVAAQIRAFIAAQ